MPWLRDAFPFPGVAPILVVGVVTRVATVLVLGALSVPLGWSGIATFVMKYLAMPRSGLSIAIELKLQLFATSGT
jgi:hypothetical protein